MRRRGRVFHELCLGNDLPFDWCLAPSLDCSLHFDHFHPCREITNTRVGCRWLQKTIGKSPFLTEVNRRRGRCLLLDLSLLHGV